MRIVYHHRTAADGAEGIHIRELIRAFRELGHEVRVAALVGEGDDGAHRLAPRASRWRRVQRLIPSAVYEVAELGYNVLGSRMVAQAIEEFRPDFVYDRYNSYSTAASNAALPARLPYVLEMNSPVAYERVAYENLPLKLPRLARRYERRICAAATHIFAVSTPLKSHLVDLYDLPSSQITVLPNGANPAIFTPSDGGAMRAKYGLDDAVIVGFVGILRPWHGVDLLLEAFASLTTSTPALRLLIVGDGPTEPVLKARAAELGLNDRVVFTGRLEHRAVGAHIAAFDVAVSPRATFYASPMKIVEYMAMQKAVVAPDMPNIRDIIRNGVTGVLFQPESVQSLASSLRSVIGSLQTRLELGSRARAAVEHTLNWRNNARIVCDTVERLRHASA